MSTSALDPTAAETEKQKRSKWRLSNPFKDKDSNLSAQTSDAQLRDSAYGSSETTDTSPAVSSQTIPTITQDQADAQGAHTETKTDARGRVVTTTTTTVITTTTVSFYCFTNELNCQQGRRQPKANTTISLLANKWWLPMKRGRHLGLLSSVGTLSQERNWSRHRPFPRNIVCGVEVPRFPYLGVSARQSP